MLAVAAAACTGTTATTERAVSRTRSGGQDELACQTGYGGASYGGHLQEWRSDILLGGTTSLPPVADRRCDGPVLYYTKACASCALVPHFSAPDLTLGTATTGIANVVTTGPSQPRCTTHPEQWITPVLRYDAVKAEHATALTAGQSAYQRFAIVKTLMLLYERYGHKLTDVQRTHARSLYADAGIRDYMFDGHVRDVPHSDWATCGETPIVHCEVPGVSSADLGTITRCARLLGGHVDPALASIEHDACLALPTATVVALASPACVYEDGHQAITLAVSDPDGSLDPAAVGLYDYVAACGTDETASGEPGPCFRHRGSRVTLSDDGCGHTIGERTGPLPAGLVAYGRDHLPQDPGCPPETGSYLEFDGAAFYPEGIDDPTTAYQLDLVEVDWPRAIDLLDHQSFALWQKQNVFPADSATADDAAALSVMRAQLHALDHWNTANDRIGRARTGPAGWMSADELAGVEADQAGALTHWWGALWTGYDVTAAVLDALAPLPCERGATDPTPCADQLEAQLATLKGAMTDGRGHTRLALQRLVRALFTAAPTPTGPRLPFATGVAVRSRLFFPLVADSFAILVSRLEELTAYHDFACLFKPCADAPSQLSRAYRLLAHLDSHAAGPSLAEVLTEPMGTVPAATAALAGWRDVFEDIADAHHPLLDALWVDYHREDGPEDFVDADSVRFRTMVVDAGVRDERYRATGQLTPGANVLSAGVTSDKLGELRDRIEERTAELRGRKQQLEQHLRELTRDLIGYVATTGDHASVAQTAKALRDEHDVITGKLDALGDNIRAADVGFAELIAQYVDLAHAIDLNETFQIDDTQTFEVTSENGSNADPDAFNPGCDEEDCFVPTRFEQPDAIRVDDPRSSVLVAKGELLQVEASGAYSPVCALRDVVLKTPTGEYHFDSDDSLIGPEGFYLQKSNSDYVAKGFSQSHGVHSDIGSGLLAKLTLGLFSAGRHSNESSNESFGSEWRFSATFNKGIQISNVPYSNMPAGALLMVTEPVGGAPIEIQVVREGVTTLIPTTHSRVSFVVNDVRCPDDQPADGDHAVTVTYKKLTTVGAYLPLVIDAMSATLFGETSSGTTTRDPIFEVDSYVAQGTLLPAETAYIQAYATTRLEQKLGVHGLSLAAVPEPLMRLYNSFVNREIVRIARGVEVSNLKQRRREITTQLRGVNAVVAQGEKAAYLHQVHLARMLSQVDEAVLRRAATELLRVSRERLYPAIKIWYPDVLDQLAHDPVFLAEVDALSRNASLDPAAPVSAWVGDDTTTGHAIENVLDMVLDAVEDAAADDVGAGEHPKYVTLAIPKPAGAACPAGAPYCMPSPATYQPGSRTLDPIRARAFWEAFYSSDPEVQRHVPLSITPEDVYSVSDSAQGLLGCHDVSAVVRRVGFTFGRVSGYGDADGPGGLNQMIRYLAGYTPRDQLFVTGAGWEKLTLAPNTPFEVFSGRAAYGFVFAPLVSINAHSNSARPIGLSPFGDFELDVWGALHGGWSFLGSEHDVAQDVTIVLEVDTRQVSFKAPGIARCADAFDPEVVADEEE